MITSFPIDPIDAALADGTPAQIVGIVYVNGVSKFVCMRMTKNGQFTVTTEATVTGIEIETGAATGE